MPEQKAIENLLFYDPDFESYAVGFREDHSSSGITHPVSTPDELIKAVEDYALVKNVELALHGSPGNIWFNGGGQMVASCFGTITSKANMLASDARVLFLGCNIAEGTAGDTFLSEVGLKMFSGIGGTVGGTTVANLAIHGGRMNPFRFFDAKLKVRRFDGSGKMIGGQDVSYWGAATNIKFK